MTLSHWETGVKTPFEKFALTAFILSLGIAVAALVVRIVHENTPPPVPVPPQGADIIARLKGQRVLPQSKAPDLLIVWVLDVRNCNACAKVETMAKHWSNAGGSKRVLLLGEPTDAVKKHLAGLDVEKVEPSPILEEIARSQSFAMLIDGVFVTFHMLAPEESQ